MTCKWLKVNIVQHMILIAMSFNWSDFIEIRERGIMNEVWMVMQRLKWFYFHNLSIHICSFHPELFIFLSFSPEPLGQFQLKALSIHGWRDLKGYALPQEEAIVKIPWYLESFNSPEPCTDSALGQIEPNLSQSIL